MKKGFGRCMLAVYAASTLLFAAVSPGPGGSGISLLDLPLSASRFSALCISTVYPGAAENFTDAGYKESPPPEKERNKEQAKEKKKGEKNPEATTAKSAKSSPSEKPKPVVLGDKPAVLILHTHATETYLPADGGNYHSKKKENSVRDVGEVLAESLEEEGVAVVHDQTLHDDPSYNSSYSRSAETARKLLNQYPTIRCIVDLHRDAIASEAPGSVLSVNGQTCARYMYVVSTAVSGYKKNLKLISAMNDFAKEDYKGFTGSVLERGYPYNQALADRCLLVEFGNNRNEITEVRNTARIWGKLLAKALKAGY